MIQDYRALAIFVAVADAGSFSRAGRRLKLSTSVVSHHITKLEARLGVALLFRTSRSLSLTAEGQSILDAARRMVMAGDEAVDALTVQSDQPVGSLRITMPAFVDRSPLRQAIWDFAKQHPLVSISVGNSDSQADLVKGRYDIAIRLGELSDSSFKCRRLADFDRTLVASPEYIASRPPIKTIDDLKVCDFVGITILSETITMFNGQQQVSFEPENIRVEVDTISAATSAVVSGLGIQRLPTSEIKDELRTGRLVPVLSDWSLPLFGIYAVWPDTGPQKHLTRLFIEHLVNLDAVMDVLNAPDGESAKT